MESRAIVHLVLHVAVPLAIALLWFRKRWQRAFVVMVLTMIVDADHLVANPVYDPGRCSIGFHPLHTWPAIIVYIACLVPSKTRLIAIGLLVHMALDAIDCAWMRW